MDRKQVLDAVKKLRESKKRNFKQSVDLAINLQHINLKDTKNRFNTVVELPSGKGKPAKICVIAEGDAFVKAKKIADIAINKDEISSWKEKKKAKKLANQVDFFIVQAQFMQQLATVLGPILGPRGKMPVPGHIVPPIGDIGPVVDKARKSIRLRLKESPVIHIILGSEEMTDDQIADNVMFVYGSIVKKLAKGKNSIKNVCLKFTMSDVVKLQ